MQCAMPHYCFGLPLMTCEYVKEIDFFFFRATTTAHIYTLSLHDALPIYSWLAHGMAGPSARAARRLGPPTACRRARHRSEEHTSELQSRFDLVCRLLLEKKKK